MPPGGDRRVCEVEHADRDASIASTPAIRKSERRWTETTLFNYSQEPEKEAGGYKKERKDKLVSEIAQKAGKPRQPLTDEQGPEAIDIQGLNTTLRAMIQKIEDVIKDLMREMDWLEKAHREELKRQDIEHLKELNMQEMQFKQIIEGLQQQVHDTTADSSDREIDNNRELHKGLHQELQNLTEAISDLKATKETGQCFWAEVSASLAMPPATAIVLASATPTQLPALAILFLDI
jgi:hypothetical protein